MKLQISKCLSWLSLLGALWLLPAQAATQAPSAPVQTGDRSLAWLYEPLLAQALELRPAEYAIVSDKKRTLPTRDGQVLVADIYRPRKQSPSPTVLVRIPLDDNDTGALFSEGIGRLWASRGYNVMVQGVRGRFGSSGEHIPFQTETEDGIDTLRWLRQQPWHDGHVGMWGGSYFGHTQWALAEEAELGLDALFIHIASSDHHAMFHPGGALAYETALFWACRSHSAIDTPPSHEQMLRAMQQRPVLEADQRTVGRPVPFFRDWVRHAQRDEYWQKADGEQRAARLQVPTLLMAGWYDPFLPSQLADYKTIQSAAPARTAYTSRLIIGPWSHAGTMRMPDGYTDAHYRLASLKPALDWYDHHLLHRSLHPFAPVRLFIGGINRWRDEQEWPLKRTRPTPIYLSSGGHANGAAGDGGLSLSPELPARADHYRHDPENPVPSLGGAILLAERSGPWAQNPVEARPDVLVYSSQPLPRNLELIGELKARLSVASSAPSTDFVVKLVDVHPDGQAYGISQGILRRRYQPGRLEPITVELWPLGHVFLKGHRLRVEVASSHFPMFDVNPNTGEDSSQATTTRIADQTLYTGAGQLSQLILPVIPEANTLPCSAAWC